MVVASCKNDCIGSWIFEIQCNLQEEFFAFFKQYKEDKLANEVSWNNIHECKFYKFMDHWWHQAGQVMKHVTTLAKDSDLPSGQSQDNYSRHETNKQQSNLPLASKNEFNLYEKAISIFRKMVENSTIMM